MRSCVCSMRGGRWRRRWGTFASARRCRRTFTKVIAILPPVKGRAGYLASFLARLRSFLSQFIADVPIIFLFVVVFFFFTARGMARFRIFIVDRFVGPEPCPSTSSMDSRQGLYAARRIEAKHSQDHLQNVSPHVWPDLAIWKHLHPKALCRKARCHVAFACHRRS